MLAPSWESGLDSPRLGSVGFAGLGLDWAGWVAWARQDAPGRVGINEKVYRFSSSPAHKSAACKMRLMSFHAD